MKLLIIGAIGFERNKEGVRIDCVRWDDLSPLQNVRDYDVLLVNLLSLQEEKTREKIDWKRFQELFDFCATSDILTNGGHIVIVGDPRFSIPSARKEEEERPFLYWTGILFSWDPQPGDTIRYPTYGAEDFAAFRKHFRSWTYSLAQAKPDEVALAERWKLEVLRKHDIRPQVRIGKICSNRYDHPLIFRARHHLADEYDRERVGNFGPILLLPKIDLDEDETLQLILRDFCDAASALPEPAWVSSYAVPGQKAIDERISQVQTTIAEQNALLEKLMQDRCKARTCLKLLFEREFGLEPVVREVLAYMGAKVEIPVEKNKEDGWITVQIQGATMEGVLEVKSTRSDQFGEDGRKQLLDWIERGRVLRQKNYKGIFIGNSAVTKPLADRPDAFSDGWKKAAELSQICAIKSEHLYIIYLLATQKKINSEEFWAQLFSTSGAFDITPFLEKIQPASHGSQGK